MKQRVGIAAFVFTLLFTVSVSVAEPESRDLAAGEDYVPGEVLVKIGGTAHQALSTEAHVKQLIESVTPGVESVKHIFSVRASDEVALKYGLDRWYRVEYAAGSDVAVLCGSLSDDQGVEMAEADYIGHMAAWPDDGLPNDPYFVDTECAPSCVNCQWALYNDDGACYDHMSAVPDADIDATEAWTISIGDTSVKIAIIDTGVDTDHPDLDDKIRQQHCYCNTAPYCPDGTTEQHGSGAAEDDAVHGTKVSGLALAETNNHEGVAGTCPLCSLIAIKALASSGGGSSGDVASSVVLAANSGAGVISMSLVFTYSLPVLADAVNYASDSGVILVAAAGNDNADTPCWPAAYPEVISVGATNMRDERWEFDPDTGSNYGDWVDVGAPGLNNRTTVPGGYDWGTMTSMATPHVAAEAALLRSLDPTMPKSVVDSLIIANVDSVITDPDKPIGGRINVHRALLGAIELAGIDLNESITGFDIQAYPNPSAGRFSIVFELARSSLCKASVYDVRGQVIKTLRDGPAYQGRNDLIWDGTDPTGIPAAPGVYFCRIQAGGTTQSRKMILAR